MQRYEVSFRIYGKALKVNVMAVSHADARYKVADAIQFDKVDKVGEAEPPLHGEPPIHGDEAMEYLKGIFGMK